MLCCCIFKGEVSLTPSTFFMVEVQIALFTSLYLLDGSRYSDAKIPSGRYRGGKVILRLHPLSSPSGSSSFLSLDLQKTGFSQTQHCIGENTCYQYNYIGPLSYAD